MSGLSSSFPSPNHEQYDEEIPSQAHQIGEDSFDPFCDLTLFLSQKIKEEIKEAGSPKQWSAKIESRLLASILPELKQKFPKYCLEKSGLKKIWEKVNYYYHKIYTQKGARHINGEIDLTFLVREHLKSAQTLSSELSFHIHARQMAVKTSECFATLNGKCLSINHLTELISGVHKHLIQGFVAVHTKPLNEGYSHVDKVIVKALLEAVAANPMSSLHELKKKVETTFDLLVAVQPLFEKNQLRSILSMLLAHVLETSPAVTLSPPAKNALKAFVNYQVRLSQTNPALLIDIHSTELIQRILALYAIAIHVPKNLDHHTIRSAVRYIYSLTKENELPSSSAVESALLVFIHAQMHLIDDQKQFNLIDLENQIIEAYGKAIALFPLASTQYEEVERIVWNAIAKKEGVLENFCPSLRAFFEKELGNILIDNPNQTFRQVVSTTFQFFKQIQMLPLGEKKSDPFWVSVREKIEIWTAQNDMVCRFIHCDEKSPLFALIASHLKNELSAPNPELVSAIHAKVVAIFPFLKPFFQLLEVRIWIWLKYFWYSKFSSSSESSYERFLKWHRSLISLKYPNWREEKLQEALEKMSDKVIPFIPFEGTRLSFPRLPNEVDAANN